jgi:hypothetical protein
MKRRDLLSHPRAHACVLHRITGRHDVWLNPPFRREGVVPLHREIPIGTAKSVCRQLGIPIPTQR